VIAQVAMASSSPHEKDVEVDTPSPKLASETSSRLDDTYEAYNNNRGIEHDPAEVKKTLRKIDTRIVPVLFFIYLLQYLDKNGINYASAFGFIEGTNLGKNGYSWLGTETQYLQLIRGCGRLIYL
jgi:hypothetical protein